MAAFLTFLLTVRPYPDGFTTLEDIGGTAFETAMLWFLLLTEMGWADCSHLVVLAAYASVLVHLAAMIWQGFCNHFNMIIDLCVNMGMDKCIAVHIDIRIHLCIDLGMDTCMYMHKREHAHVRVCAYRHAHRHVNKCLYVRIYAHAGTHVGLTTTYNSKQFYT